MLPGQPPVWVKRLPYLAKLGCNVAINYRGNGLRPAFGHREQSEDTRALAVAAACDAEDACQLQTFLVPRDVSQDDDVIAKVALVVPSSQRAK